ncbi:MAG TPA: biopolymer transporter ExbD [bacterium]
MKNNRMQANQNRNGFQPIRRDSRKRKTEINLRLTSMIDMFTILLVFLLKNFSTEGQVISVSQDLKLPVSTAEKPPEVTSVIAITEELLLLDGKSIVAVDRLAQDEKLLIPELFAELKQLRNLNERMGAISSSISFTGKISIQADRELPYLVIKKIMFTCGQVGYNDMLLTVNKPD